MLTGCIPTAPGSGGDTGTESAESSESSESSETTEARQLDAAPATGITISTDEYSYAVPEGWEVPESIPGFSPHSFAADMSDMDGFADNVNVFESPNGLLSPEDVEATATAELESVGASTVEIGERVMIADSISAHVTAVVDRSEPSYAVEQYYVSTDDQTYIVTFSYSGTVPADERVDIAESVLAAWQWS